MRHVVTVQVVCESCKRKVSVVCFWFNNEEEAKEFFKTRLGFGKAELFGERIRLDSGHALAGKYVGYVRHGLLEDDRSEDCANKKKCIMGGKAPRSDEVIRIVAEAVQSEDVSCPDVLAKDILEKKAVEKSAKPERKKRSSYKGYRKTAPGKESFDFCLATSKEMGEFLKSICSDTQQPRLDE